MSGIIYVFGFCVFVTVHGVFPEDPKPCKYGDSQCIVNIMNRFLSEKAVEGDSNINLVKLDPFPVDTLRINSGGDRAFNIDVTFVNNQIYGMKSIRATSARGFGKDLTKKYEIRITTDVISLVGPYTINGKVLILPITGKGNSNMTLVKSEVVMSFKGKAIERDGETYMEPVNMKLEAKPLFIIYHFSNLFNGDKALGDNMNLFLNDNWEAISNEVRPALQVAVGNVFQGIIAKVFSKYPYSKYFEE